MYYRKLMEIYEETDCHNYFSKYYVEALSDYILSVEKDAQLKYLNPYEFSSENKLTLQETLKFFMYFTDQENGVIRILPFVECFSSSCSERLFFEDSIEDDLLLCEDCGKDYDLTQVEPFMKIYFQYQDHESVVDENLLDRNSPFEILNGIDYSLKFESPSSHAGSTDEGDPSVEFGELVQNNIKPDGQPITNAIPSPTSLLMNKLSSRRAR
ncbi:hypothetical protein J6TS2_33460 [Heyndrickxia sporothermodurans]|nr:hypothetical protein J6TS2_33460 [Heyndrickxia sporothermodurans]